LASGFAIADLHHAVGHDQVLRLGGPRGLPPRSSGRRWDNANAVTEFVWLRDKAMFCVGGARAPASGASIMVCVGALSLKIFSPFLGSLAASATREERHRPGRFSESKQSASPRPVSMYPP
ncbi:hypothetical protein, partial [Mesorhizobium sp.]